MNESGSYSSSRTRYGPAKLRWVLRRKVDHAAFAPKRVAYSMSDQFNTKVGQGVKSYI